MSEFHYIGSELDIFAAATNWKTYWAHKIQPYVTGDVVEVGAGFGSNTKFLSAGAKGRWVGLEPDPKLAAQLTQNLSQLNGTCRYESVCGTLEDLPKGDTFDTLVYIDVLEHIEDDAAELTRATARLRPGGRVIVLSPAHQWLFTPFDAQIGHFRRYNRTSLRAASPAAANVESIFYLDACGILASATNQLFLRQSMPTSAQIGVWDKWIVPVSRMLDPLLFFSLGKSIVGIWRKPSS
jgi:SAM-dependent methyltransferase